MTETAQQPVKEPSTCAADGGVGDWPRLPPQGDRVGRGKGNGGNGKGGKNKNKNNTFEGKPVCYNWNRKADFKAGRNCRMAHVFLKCHGAHAAVDCPTQEKPQERSPAPRKHQRRETLSKSQGTGVRAPCQRKEL